MRYLIVFFTLVLNLSSEVKKYTMDNNYFSLNYPSDMLFERNKENDSSGIYKVVFISQDKKTTITVKYYSPKSGKDYKSFIKKQTGDNTATEKYEKPKEVIVGKRKAIEIVRYFKEFEDITVKTNSYWLKERLIVIPSKKGFYTIAFSSEKDSFDKKSEIFENILKSFKTKY